MFANFSSYIFSFKIEFVSIFGYSTQQLFYLYINENKIVETMTVIVNDMESE